MSNNYFQFRQFTIRQQRCAMKVGTDGTLLGAWASPLISHFSPLTPHRILDVGTGTGLIALMMAQRFPLAQVTGIDIDADAALQATENVAASPFASRVTILQHDVATMEGVFDVIVCNPPFFAKALHSPDAQRSVARHDDTLTYAQLMQHARRLLGDDGELSVVVPADQQGRMGSEAALAGFFKSRECAVRTSERTVGILAADGLET